MKLIPTKSEHRPSYVHTFLLRFLYARVFLLRVPCWRGGLVCRSSQLYHRGFSVTRPLLTRRVSFERFLVA